MASFARFGLELRSSYILILFFFQKNHLIKIKYRSKAFGFYFSWKEKSSFYFSIPTGKIKADFSFQKSKRPKALSLNLILIKWFF